MDTLIKHALAPADVATTSAIERFLYLEADLLDDWEFDQWLELLAEDLHYWAPVRENRTFRERRFETAAPGESAYFEETRADMVQRVDRLNTHMAWAEDPPSRSRHLVTNVRAFNTATEGEYAVASNFCVYRTRGERDQDLIVGSRRDVLRTSTGPAGFELVGREVRFDMSTLLIKNLSTFY